MPNLIHRARRFLFGYDAIEANKRRRPPSAVLRSEDGELDDTGRRQLVGGSRDIRRNYTVASWMVRRHLDYVTTFHFQSRTGNKELDRKVESFVKNWSKRENYDVAGRHNLQRALRLAEGMRTIDGDVLCLRLADGRVQWIEGDRIREGQGLPTTVDRNQLVHGVLVDDFGAAKAYAICKRGLSQGLFSQLASSFTFERFVAARNAYLHAYQDRFDQVRGISPIATALNEMRDTYEAFDYARARMKIAQMFGLVFYRQAFGGDEPGQRLSQDGDGYSVQFSKGPAVLNLDPGDKAEFLDNRTPSTEFQAFTDKLILIALKSLDIPFSFFSEDFTNYSGSRGAMLQYERAAESKRQDNKDLLDWQTGWRLQLAQLDGELPGADMQAVLNGLQWHPRGMPWIDPLKERLADIQAVGAGMETRTRLLREQGLDFEEVVAELAQEAKLLREAGLPLNLEQSNALITSLTEDNHAGQPAAK